MSYPARRPTNLNPKEKTGLIARPFLFLLYLSFKTVFETYCGTICRPFKGALWNPSTAALGIAVSVNAGALMVNTT